MTLRQNDGVAMTEQQLDVHASMELSDAQMEGVAGGLSAGTTEADSPSGYRPLRVNSDSGVTFSLEARKSGNETAA